MFNIYDEINRINRSYAVINGLPVPAALMPAGQSADIPLAADEIPRSLLKPPSLAEIVQDRAAEMITHCDNAERVEAIGNELYTLAERVLGRPVSSDTRRHDEAEIRGIVNFDREPL